MEPVTVLVFALGLLVVLVPIALVWYINIGGILQAIRMKSLEKLSCKLDSDCPAGFICVNGRCVKAAS